MSLKNVMYSKTYSEREVKYQYEAHRGQVETATYIEECCFVVTKEENGIALFDQIRGKQGSYTYALVQWFSSYDRDKAIDSAYDRATAKQVAERMSCKPKKGA